MRRFLMLTALIAPILSRPVASQAFPTDDPVIKRMWSLGMDSSHTWVLAHTLFDSLGPRLTATPGMKRAQDWVVSMYKSWGVDAKLEQYGTWRGWRRGYSHIDLIEPRVRTLEGQMVGYSPGTGGKPVELSTIILPKFADSAAFVRWLPQAKGKLVLAAPALPTCRPAEQWAMFGTEASIARNDSLVAAILADWSGRGGRGAPGGASSGVHGTGYSIALGGGELGVRLEQGGAAGLITSRPKLTYGRGGGGGRGSSGQIGTMEVFETYNTRTPTIALSCEDYGLVYRLTEHGDKPKLRLDLDAQLLGEVPVYNAIATIRGTEKPDEYVLLSAHFDSWDGSSGATDNGTGTLTMLEAMRIIRLAYPRPKRTIIVGHWSAEEEGLVGSRAWSEDHPEVVKGLQAVYNQDNGTGRIQNISGGGLVKAPEHITAWLAKMPQEFQKQINFGGVGAPSGGGSDGASFSCYGGPAFGVGGVGWDYSSLTWHTDRDTFDKVVLDDLKGNATIVAMLAYLASEDPAFIPRDRVDLAAAAAAAGRAAGGGRGGPPTWPECQKAPRKTNPRLK